MNHLSKLKLAPIHVLAVYVLYSVLRVPNVKCSVGGAHKLNGNTCMAENLA